MWLSNNMIKRPPRLVCTGNPQVYFPSQAQKQQKRKKKNCTPLPTTRDLGLSSGTTLSFHLPPNLTRVGSDGPSECLTAAAPQLEDPWDLVLTLNKIACVSPAVLPGELLWPSTTTEMRVWEGQPLFERMLLCLGLLCGPNLISFLPFYVLLFWSLLFWKITCIAFLL